ncbi:MAG TPA: SHOCT domain-containing protein [Candidatus Paceibacterota bacterium]|nr:SHOCT domain-containing protein [Candidatus Paceibacterota bacterium]
MDNPVRQLSGINGQVDLFEDKVVIRRKGLRSLMTQGLKGDKNIYFDSITSIQLKTPTFVTNGFIQFGVLGGNESRGGLFSATTDENSIMIKKKSLEDALFIKDFIENKKRTKSSGHHAQSSVADELKKLNDLLKDGVISQSDFDNQKKKLLD